MLLAGFFFALMNICVKAVSHLPTIEVVFFRSIFTFVITFYLLRKKSIPLLGNNKTLLSLRGIAGCLGLVGSFYTLQHIPLASAVTINYLSPFFTAVLGIFIVKQRLRSIQFLYFAIAILGVLLLKGFDYRIDYFDLSIGLSAALFAGLAYNIISKLRGTEHPLVIMFYFPLVTLPIVTLLSIPIWEQPIGIDWLYLLLIGILTQCAQYYMTVAYQIANLAKVASLNYLGVVYALAFGYFLFDESIHWVSLLAICLIIGSVFLNLRTRQA